MNKLITSPKKVLEILKKSGLNIKATNEDELQKYKNNEIVKALLEFRKANKICTTYTKPLYKEAKKSKDGRIHARFSQNTITGRLASSDPVNLQNQPNSVRTMFIAENGKVLIGADWSNIELRLPAHFSGEADFVGELSKPAGDLHTRTANFLFGEKFSNAEKEIQKDLRQKAKTCNFLLTNSGTASRLATELQIDQKTSEELYRRFWEGYPTLREWLKKEKELARKNGGIMTMFGRWVPIPQLSLTCGRWNCASIDKWCAQCSRREEAERQAISCLVQGSASDLMKLSAIRLYNEYGLVPILSVHDELVYQIDINKQEEVKQQIKSIMENIVTLKVPLKVDVKIGKNWAEAH